MFKNLDETFFLVGKENIIMTGTTGAEAGSIPFIIYRTGKSQSMYISTRFVLEGDAYRCRYDHTRGLCDGAEALRRMRVDDIERKAQLADRGRVFK